ncbi:MAG: response regulator, partial [Syntrophobacteraceae bacterium]
EERVIQRTLALEKKTEEAQELAHRATEASRAKSQFLANMSHEIRTPMNGVIGLTELMLNTTLTEKQSGLARMVLHSGEALLRIINDILDFSKIEAGRLELDLIDFNLWETIEEVVALFAEHAHRKEIELICDIRTSVPVNVNGDPVRLRQVLTNLLGNAVKFTERGEVMVRTTAFRKEDEIHTLEFEIIDTGIGIPPNARTRIFDAFSQADGSMSRKYGGTGLGLAICRQLVEMMGGSIALESTPGCGSTFRFSVQLVERPETSVKTSAGKESLRGARLLIADDNEANRLVLAERTESWGMNCKTAVDGSSALEVLREAGSRNEPFDLAILDKMMPGMDGLELARSIKADPSISSVRIIMLTSPGEFIETDEVRQSGILAYLSKPVRQSSLYDILLGALQTGENWEVSLPGHRSQSCPANPSFRGSILVAEDNAINQMVIKSMLLGMGLRVEVVATGQQALAQFAAKSFDLIFMDCQMPEMDGYEAARKMREKEEASLNRNDSHVPIVALTAHAMEGDQDLCIQAGMDDYLSKPFTYKQLCSVLERWITPVRNVQ